MSSAARERSKKIENVKSFSTSSFNLYDGLTSFGNLIRSIRCVSKEPRCFSVRVCVKRSLISCNLRFKCVFPYSNRASVVYNRLLIFYNRVFNRASRLVFVLVNPSISLNNQVSCLFYSNSWSSAIRSKSIVSIVLILSIVSLIFRGSRGSRGSRRSRLSESKGETRITRISKITGNFVSIRPLKQDFNRDRLKRSGDVESNPGPGQVSNFVFPECPTQSTQSTPPTVPTLTTLPTVNDGQRTRAPVESEPGTTKARRKSDLQVMTLNVRGLSDKRKIRHLVNFCYKKSTEADDSVFMLQETHSTNLGVIKYIWRGDYCETAGTGASKGCLTLVSPMLKVLKVKHYDQRAHIAIIGKNNEMRADMLLVNVYAPNKNDSDKLEFFVKLVEDLTELQFEYNCDKVIFAGDLNLVFDKNEVKNRACPLVEKNLASSVKSIFTSAGLSDGWDHSASEKSYTWMVSRNGKQLFSTLDRVLYNNTRLILTTMFTDWSISVSDHAAVFAKFHYSINQAAKSHIARLDPTLLKDEESRSVLDSNFKDLFDQRLAHWSPHQSLEYAKLCIRTAANAASNFRKSQYRDVEAEVNANINQLVGKLAEMKEGDQESLVTQACLDEQRNLKRDLVNKIGTKIEQRTARKWYNEGELANKYFLNILRRKTSDTIESLEVDGELTNDQTEISDGVVNFYKDLYELKENSTPSPNAPNLDDIKKEFFSKVEPIPPEEEATVTAPVSVEELWTVLDNCVDSAPGPDGIPYSYLKYFWKEFGQILALAWEQSIRTGELPPSHKQSYLKLIPKAGKDLTKIGNWRPITLSNTDHKLVTKAYSKRVTNAVKSKISEEQTAYIEGRLINDNIRAMIRTIDLANEDQTVDGIVISLDARKAFDSVDHSYIKDTLTAFGLGNFVGIFNILYKGLKSDIIINGDIKRGYKIERGVKQGDALSCILFIMCIEPLLRNIKANSAIAEIKSAKISLNLPKAYSYADDITALTVNKIESVQALFHEYERLSKLSGLILNADKTELLCFNQQPNVRVTHEINYLTERFKIESMDRIKVNGIFLMQDPEQRIEANVKKVTDAINRQLTSWSTRSLSLLGKILIIKTFAISQAIYLMQTCSIPARHLKLIEAPIYKFLWNKNFKAAKAPDRIKREIINTPIELGGFGLLNIFELDRGIKLKSLGRLMVTGHPYFAQLRRLINLNDFFEPRINECDVVLKESLMHLKSDRLQVLEWPLPLQTSCVSLMAVLRELRISALLKPGGRRTIPFILLGRNREELKVKELSASALETLIPHLKYQRLGTALRESRSLNIERDRSELESLYPTSPGQMGDLRKMSSQMLRKLRTGSIDRLICIYKIGLVLQPAEVLAWMKQCRRLTSVRHRSTLLRIAHGDIFSNSRLFKFGLIPQPNCENCNCDSETIIHKVLECPVTREAWAHLSAQKVKLGMISHSAPTIESILGVSGEESKLAKAMNMELLVKILSNGGKRFDPSSTVKRVVKSIYINEPMKPEMRDKFKALINEA